VKLVSVLGLLAVLTLTLASLAGAAAPNALKTFGSGAVTVTGSKSATIVNGASQYGGVYVGSKSLSGKSLAKVDFEFTATGDTAGGAPRFSMPINDGAFDENSDHAFIDVANCGGSVVSTENAACKVYFGSESHANWDAFAAAHPTWKIADAIPFIIADQPGTYNVSGIDLR
jgi:hypothetical protein